jgi:hypothetical protein
MNIEPLPSTLLEEAISLNVEKFVLRFSGGSDEGTLEVDVSTKEPSKERTRLSALEKRIHDWADEAYEYSGAGDGTPYGDNITYDLLNMEVQHTEYHMVETSTESEPVVLSVAPENEKAGE